MHEPEAVNLYLDSTCVLTKSKTNNPEMVCSEASVSIAKTVRNSSEGEVHTTIYTLSVGTKCFQYL